jgi:hypothetical protein
MTSDGAEGNRPTYAMESRMTWMDLTDPENPVELGFVPVEWRTIGEGERA